MALDGGGEKLGAGEQGPPPPRPPPLRPSRHRPSRRQCTVAERPHLSVPSETGGRQGSGAAGADGGGAAAVRRRPRAAAAVPADSPLRLAAVPAASRPAILDAGRLREKQAGGAVQAGSVE